MIDIEKILDEISVLPELKQQVSSKQIMLQTVEGCTDPYFGTGYIYQFSKGGVHVQGDYKDEVIGVEYMSKKGKQISTSVKIPVGRKIREALIIEKRRLAQKAAREAREKSRYASNQS